MQWVWDQPEVAVVLSGMGTLDQVKQNLLSADSSGINSLSVAEQQLIAAVRQQYRARSAIVFNVRLVKRSARSEFLSVNGSRKYILYWGRFPSQFIPGRFSARFLI